MNLEKLEKMLRLALVGQSRPTLAAVADNGALNEAFDGEFAGAVDSLSARSQKPGTKPTDPDNWA